VDEVRWNVFDYLVHIVEKLTRKLHRTLSAVPGISKGYFNCTRIWISGFFHVNIQQIKGWISANGKSSVFTNLHILFTIKLRVIKSMGWHFIAQELKGMKAILCRLQNLEFEKIETKSFFRLNQAHLLYCVRRRVIEVKEFHRYKFKDVQLCRCCNCHEETLIHVLWVSFPPESTLFTQKWILQRC